MATSTETATSAEIATSAKIEKERKSIRTYLTFIHSSIIERASELKAEL